MPAPRETIGDALHNPGPDGTIFGRFHASSRRLRLQEEVMGTPLDQAVEKVKALSPERQRYAADVLEQIAEAGDGIYQLSVEERSLIKEGLAELDRGEAATEAQVRAVFDRYRR
jgi:predicted transcriptional regulator